MAQFFARILGEIGQAEVLAPTGTGLELDRDEAQEARQEFLLEADILDALVGHRARRPAQHPALDANVLCADGIGQPLPAKITECRPDRDDRDADGKRDEQPRTGAAEADQQERDDGVLDALQQADQHAHLRRVVRLRACRRRLRRDLWHRNFGWASGVAHIVSRLICARISSRMSFASRSCSPGRWTEAL